MSLQTETRRRKHGANARPMSYARARLFLGIGGVGTMVVLAGAVLALELPHRLLGDVTPSMAGSVLGLAAALAVYLVVSLPFDLAGGYVLPRYFGRPSPLLGQFWAGWARGAAVHAATMLVSLTLLLAAGRTGGRTLVLLTLVALMGGLLLLQEWLARLTGHLRRTPIDLTIARDLVQGWGLQVPPVVSLAHTDPAFVGGVVGLPGCERIVLPAGWHTGLPAEAIAVQLARRVGVMRTGSRLRGVALAMIWNVVGFGLASYGPGAGVTSAASLVATVAGFTLWSFIGLLLLPTASRPGVMAADTFARAVGVPEPWLGRTAHLIDRLQDDEPERSRLVETVFHPIPSVNNRLAHRPARQDRWGAWQGARVALFLSWAGGGLLARAVHCNAGRPELWVLLPGD